MSSDETIGELTERFVDKVFEWRIDYVEEVLCAEDDRGRCYRSDSFEFADTWWYLSLYPHGMTYPPSEAVSLFLVRETPGDAIQVALTLGVKTDSGAVEKRIVDTVEFGDPEVVSWWSRGKFLPRSELFRRMNELAPDDTMTVTLTMTVTEHDAGPVSHFPLLSEQMKNMFLEGEDCDVTFRVQGETFGAHKNILRARCPALFTSLDDDGANVLDCDPDTFVQFLLYVYGGSVPELSFDNAFGLYELADVYEMRPLRDRCVAFMAESLTTREVGGVARFAHEHREAELFVLATNFFILHVDEIIESAEWGKFLRQYPDDANTLYIKSARKFSKKRRNLSRTSRINKFAIS